MIVIAVFALLLWLHVAWWVWALYGVACGIHAFLWAVTHS